MGVIQARDLSKHGIRSASEGLDVLKKAMANRMVSFNGNHWKNIKLGWKVTVIYIEKLGGEGFDLNFCGYLF